MRIKKDKILKKKIFWISIICLVIVAGVFTLSKYRNNVKEKLENVAIDLQEFSVDGGEYSSSSVEQKNPADSDISLKGIITNVDKTYTAILEMDGVSYVVMEGEVLSDFWIVDIVSQMNVKLVNEENELEKMLLLN